MTQAVAVLSRIPRLSHHLRRQLPNLSVFDVSPGKGDTAELKDAEILIADCDLLVPYVDDLPSLKWVQFTWAGVNKFVANVQGKKLNFTLTRFSGESFGNSMSEYVIAHIFNYERDQRRQYENQKSRCWDKEGKVEHHRLICDLNIGILGLGSIGKTIAQNLKMLGATVWGMSRTAPQEKLHYIDEHRTVERLPEVLENCDYIINVLPSTPDTVGLLNGNALKHCEKKQGIFMNIGRGTVIKESDLINAIEQKWISGAILDVFEEEPLPKESKLWTLPQVTISPHISGVTRGEDVAKVFAENYDRFSKGESLLYTFDWQRGY